MDVRKVLPNLNHIAECAEDSSSRTVEGLIETVAEFQGRLDVIDGWIQRGAANEAQARLRQKIPRYCPRVFQAGAALMVIETFRKTRVDGRLGWIGKGPVELIEAEACVELGLFREPVVNAHRKLIGKS